MLHYFCSAGLHIFVGPELNPKKAAPEIEAAFCWFFGGGAVCGKKQFRKADLGEAFLVVLTCDCGLFIHETSIVQDFCFAVEEQIC